MKIGGLVRTRCRGYGQSSLTISTRGAELEAVGNFVLVEPGEMGIVMEPSRTVPGRGTGSFLRLLVSNRGALWIREDIVEEI